jgi:hypothetical protein
MGYKNPYPECENCKTLGDCPHPDVAQDLLGSPMPPDLCPRPLTIMANTLKKRKLKFSQYLKGDD